MRLETAALFGSKVKEFPLPSIYARSKLYTGRGENKTLDFKNTQYILNSDHDRLGFVLDRRGYFKSPADLDALFLRQPIPTR
ncbi:hypothetical protein EV182_001728 [Spiromyces aspiralis]|uniref:Uncharacterized protein n=1 Tax=Spiromyces aspiralis TaxID=68401 RepID=A0ACC1HIR3_9FUNG|nr:hypothetical protein EV182_001728 [Spiromyces aspiralis]